MTQEQEPPKYSFKTYWEKDGRIGVVAVVERPDGGFHVLENIIDAPQRTWVDLTDEEVFGLFGRFTAMTGKSWLDLYRMTEAKLKEKNT